MILATAILTFVLFAAQAHATEAPPSPDISPSAGTAITIAPTSAPIASLTTDSDDARRDREYGLPDRERSGEGEGEDGDGDYSKLPGSEFDFPPFTHPVSSRHGIAISNRRLLGSGPEARTPTLRC